jgi:predicted RNA-binding Zn-ribbon protein involved in translation (DUF1610 family)
MMNGRIKHTGWVCIDCGKVLDNLKRVDDEETGAWFVCPNCNSVDVHKAARCPVCDETGLYDEILAHDGCAACRAAVARKYNAFVDELSRAERNVLDELFVSGEIQ